MELVFVKNTFMIFHFLLVERVIGRVEHSDKLDVSFSEDFGLLLFLLGLLFLLWGFLVLNNLFVECLDCVLKFGKILLKSLPLEFILVLLPP